MSGLPKIEWTFLELRLLDLREHPTMMVFFSLMFTFPLLILLALRYIPKLWHVFFIIYNVFSHFIEIFVSDDGVCSWYTTTLEDFGLIQTCITVEKYALACLVPGVGKVVRSGIQLNQPCYRFLSPFKLSFWMRSHITMSQDTRPLPTLHMVSGMLWSITTIPFCTHAGRCCTPFGGLQR